MVTQAAVPPEGNGLGVGLGPKRHSSGQSLEMKSRWRRDRAEPGNTLSPPQPRAPDLGLKRSENLLPGSRPSQGLHQRAGCHHFPNCEVHAGAWSPRPPQRGSTFLRRHSFRSLDACSLEAAIHLECRRFGARAIFHLPHRPLTPVLQGWLGTPAPTWLASIVYSRGGRGYAVSSPIRTAMLGW